MKDSILIKSSAHGLTIHFAHDIGFEQLITDLCTKFAENRAFFGECELILTVEGRSLTCDELEIVIEAIELNSDIHIKMIHSNDEIEEYRTQQQLKELHDRQLYNHAKIINGSIPKGEELTFDGSVVILGDIKKNAVINADGNIIVYGTIMGTANAGVADDKHAYVICEKVEQGVVTIGSITNEIIVKDKWFKRTKANETTDPIAIIVMDNMLYAEPLSSGILKHRK